jgi:hypothetical protein
MRWPSRILIAIAMVFLCVNSCRKSFSNQRGLSNHENACSIYKRHIHSVAQRKAGLAKKAKGGLIAVNAMSTATSRQIPPLPTPMEVDSIRANVASVSVFSSDRI